MFRKLKAVFSRPKLSPEEAECKNEGVPPPPKASTGQVSFLLFSIDSVILPCV